MTRYLGIDPGSTIIGYGIIEDAGGSLKCVEYGTLRNPGKDSSADKRATADALTALISKFKPQAAAVEKLFVFQNQRSVMAVSEMRGVIMLALAQHNIPTLEFTPLQVKQQICGHGRAQKHQMQKMMRLLLHLNQDIRPDDAADALAIALCCAVSPKGT